MSLELSGARVMVVGLRTRLREALGASLTDRGALVVVPCPAEFDMTREAGAARALSAIEPEVVICLGTRAHVGDAAGAGTLGGALSTVVNLIGRSGGVGVRHFVWVGGAWPEADAVLGAMFAEPGEGRGAGGTVVVPDPEGSVLEIEAVAGTIVDRLGRAADGCVVTLPGRFHDALIPELSAEEPAFLLPPVEEIADGDQVVAVILRGSLSTPGVSFYSRDHFSQQLGFIHHPAGHVIPPHVHNAVPREVTYTQETLFVREGRLRVDLYRDDRTLLTRRVLAAGDVILLCTGGHGFEVLEESSIVEVKQGPYAGDGDKTRFEAAE